MKEDGIILSAVMVIGPIRTRAQRAYDALCAQTRRDVMEVIIVDMAENDVPPLSLDPGMPTHYLRQPSASWGNARNAGLQQAVGDIVAFIEDHCYACPDWADALLTAYQGPWAAVGYAFVNANPDTYASRAGMIADYMQWMHPTPDGPRRLLPGNNVSYRRETLLQFGERLEMFLSPDFLIHENYLQRGLPMCIAGQALVAHENFDHLAGLFHSNYAYCRLLAANRVQAQRWGWPTRLLYGLGVPLGAPAIKLARFCRSLRGRRPLWMPFAGALPVILSTFLLSAIGESLGYLFGPGTASNAFNKWELEEKRMEAGHVA